MSIEKDITALKAEMVELRTSIERWSDRLLAAHEKTSECLREVGASLEDEKTTTQARRTEHILDFAGRLRASSAEHAMLELIRTGRKFEPPDLVREAWEIADLMVMQWEGRSGDHRVG